MEQDLEHLVFVLDMEVRRLKGYPIGHFCNKEAMAIHQATLHKVYWQLQDAKAKLAEQKKPAA